MTARELLQPKRYDPALDLGMPDELHAASHAISDYMKRHGSTMWCYGPIADRALVDELENKLREAMLHIKNLTAAIEFLQ